MVQEINFPIYPGPNKPEGKPRGKGYSLIQLLQFAARQVDSKNATYVHLVKLEKLKDSKGRLAVRAQTRTVSPINTPPTRDHYCSIRVKDINYTGKIYQAPHVLVDCSCPQFCYIYDYCAFYWGYGMMLRCDQTYPEQTNPMLNRKGFCKHLVALGVRVLSSKV